MNRMKNIPKSRKGFERNMGILEESFHRGTVHIDASLRHTMRGVEKVRVLPNQRVNMLSVNESARLHANSVAHFSTMMNREDELPTDE